MHDTCKKGTACLPHVLTLRSLAWNQSFSRLPAGCRPQRWNMQSCCHTNRMHGQCASAWSLIVTQYQFATQDKSGAMGVKIFLIRSSTLKSGCLGNGRHIGSEMEVARPRRFSFCRVRDPSGAFFHLQTYFLSRSTRILPDQS